MSKSHIEAKSLRRSFGRIGAMADRNEIESRWQLPLRPETLKDYGPNGLQVDGRREVRRVVSGVTACQAFIDAAMDAGADVFIMGELDVDNPA